MDIRKEQSIRPDRGLIERNRERMRAFREGAQGSAQVDRGRPRDRVDLSDRLEAALTAVQREHGEKLDRTDLAVLKRLHEAGRLNTPERLLQAAGRLLGAD